MSNPEMTQELITVDESTVTRINKMRQSADISEFGPATMLRIAVTSGGCSGFQYIMEPAETVEEDDTVYDGVVIVDSASAEIMKGSKIVFKDDMMGAQFVVDNPNAQSGCGCGASFSMKL